MMAKLRTVGNSVGVIVPASELRAINAKAGDTVELEIKHVVRTARAGWNDPDRWPGAKTERLLLDGAPDNLFDDEEWVW